MLIRTSLATAGRMVVSSVAVQLDTEDNRYVAAYGDPTISLGGAIAYSPQASQSEIQLARVLDLGVPPTGGEVLDIIGLPQRSISLTASGQDSLALTRGSMAVTASVDDVEVSAVIVASAGAPGSFTGISLWFGETGTSIGVLLGWTGTAVELRLRSTVGGTATVVATVARANPYGLCLRLRRQGTTVTAYMGEGSATTVFGTCTVPTGQAFAGLFMASGSSTPTAAVYQSMSIRPYIAASFTAPTRTAAMRGGSPHEMSLSLDETDATVKAAAWGSAITDRVVTARDALLAMPDPTPTSVTRR